MEELAKKTIANINEICLDFYYFRKENVMERGVALLDNVQEVFKQINILATENPNDKEVLNIENYAINVLNDLVEAIERKDQVLLVDTLDYGVRDLMKIFVDEREEDE